MFNLLPEKRRGAVYAVSITYRLDLSCDGGLTPTEGRYSRTRILYQLSRFFYSSLPDHILDGKKDEKEKEEEEKKSQEERIDETVAKRESKHGIKTYWIKIVSFLRISR